LRWQLATNFVPIIWIVHMRFARAAPPAYYQGVIYEVDVDASLTTPIDRAAVNQFLLVQSAALCSRAMGYDKKCKCCAERRRTN